jgi:hypothetical protein
MPLDFAEQPQFVSPKSFWFFIAKFKFASANNDSAPAERLGRTGYELRFGVGAPWRKRKSLALTEFVVDGPKHRCRDGEDRNEPKYL